MIHFTASLKNHLSITAAILCIGFAFPSFAQPNTPAAADTATSITEKDTSTTAKKKKSDIQDTISYESDNINYDADGKVLYLSGKSIVKYQNLTLIADTIVYKIDQNIFTASGLPKLVEGNDTTTGDYMVYNIKTRRGRVQVAQTHLDDAYFNGQRIIKTDKNELYVDQGDYTTCSVVDTPHFFFYGKNIKVVPNDKIISRPVVLNIGNSPVAVLPYFIFPIERNRRSGILTPAWGGHPNSGGYIDNIGYYWAPNDYLDFLLKGKVMEFREFVIEGASNYKIKYLLDGGISARYALNSDFLSNSSQWAINYHHNQNLTPDGLTTLSGRGDLLSQKNTTFFEEYSDDTKELLNQEIKANLTLNRRFEKINASTSLNWNRTHNLSTNRIDENLPSASFSLPSRPLFPAKSGAEEEDIKWFNKISAGYNANGFVDHKIDSVSYIDIDTLRKRQSDTYHPAFGHSMDLTAPLTIFKYFTLNPNISARHSLFYGYVDTTTKRVDSTKYLNVTYKLKGDQKDNQYSDYELVKTDTLSRDAYGKPDSVSITKRKRMVITEYDTTYAMQNVATWRAGLSLSTKPLYGIFPIRILNFVGLRHTLTPSLSYTFTPEHDQKTLFLTSKIDNIGAIKKAQTVSININNLFEGKIEKPGKDGEKPVSSTFSILSLGLSTGYNFEADSRKWNDLSLNASTSYKMLRVNYSSSFWFYDQHDKLSFPIMRNMNLDFSVGSLGAKGSFWNGNLFELDSVQKLSDKGTESVNQNWEFSFTPQYSFSMSRSSPTEMFKPDKKYSLNASAKLNFTKNWSLSWSSNYNFTEDQWVQNSFNLACDLECWDMRFQWRPEKLNPGYYFLINIKKIPEIKWEQKN